jgi:hypothetical protein
MRVLNAFRAKLNVPDKMTGFYVRFEGLSVEKKEDRRARLQSITRTLCRKGFDTAIAPEEAAEKFDLVVLKSDEGKVTGALERYSDLNPRVFPFDAFGREVVGAAWQNRIRITITSSNLMKTGDRYVMKQDLLDGSTPYKKSYRVQSAIENENLVVWIDARTRIVHPLTDDLIEDADQMGDESEVRVRVLPNWTEGVLVGKAGKKARDLEVAHEGRMLGIPEYWRFKHGIDFVDPDDDLLDVHVPSFGRTLQYPRSCVFSEYKRGIKLPESLKKEPDERVQLAKDFVRDYLRDVQFLGQKVIFEGPLAPRDLAFEEHQFQPAPAVVVGSNQETPVDQVHNALKIHGPYSGPLNGRVIVIHCGKKDRTRVGVEAIERAYSRLRLGTLQLAAEIGDGGYVDTTGEKAADFTSTIAALRSRLGEVKERILAFLVLPSAYSSEVYFKARDGLFERVFGTEPFPCQAFGFESVEKIVSGHPGANAIAANTASQCYIKYGGTGTAVWILKEPADRGIPGIASGSSCYAYHDVSRRPRLKASATAFSAMTDPYGRYIATGTKPVGGEKLSPPAFHDILVELIQKVNFYSQRYEQLQRDEERRFTFARLVFAKDGIIRDDEAEMMENVIMKGIPEENKEPIPELLRRIPTFPKKLVIDIIGVNKSPNKRLFNSGGSRFYNVQEGSALAYNEKEGLLISFGTRMGSAQPIEISLKKHLCLNYEEPLPTPHVAEIMQEYYLLTNLNWASLFRQGKFALPQILTQNLGENITAGVRVPDDMPLL